MRPSMLALWPLLALCFRASAEPAESVEYRLHHRILYPTIDEPLPYALRGRILLTAESENTAAVLESVDHLQNDLKAFQGIVEELHTRHLPEEVLYQLALEREEDPASWSISSVKACHLIDSLSDRLVVHLDAQRRPFTLDYFVVPVPADGSCPTPSASVPFQPLTNSTLVLKEARRPPLPDLHQPPPLNPQGEVVKPPPEQSFLQKYWMYIAIALVALMMAPSPPEEGGEGGGSGGGGGGGGRGGRR